MQKIILKSAIVTLIAFFILAGLLLGLLSVSCPKALANINTDLGNEGASIYFWEKQYKKTDSVYDLEKLIYVVNESGTVDERIKYNKEMLDHEDFNKLCDERDKDSKYVSNFSDYVAGNYVCALYEKDGEEAVKVAKTLTNDYNQGNPLRSLITAVAKDDKEVLEALKIAIASFNDGENRLVESDISLVEEMIAAI